MYYRVEDVLGCPMTPRSQVHSKSEASRDASHEVTLHISVRGVHARALRCPESSPEVAGILVRRLMASWRFHVGRVPWLVAPSLDL